MQWYPICHRVLLWLLGEGEVDVEQEDLLRDASSALTHCEHKCEVEIKRRIASAKLAFQNKNKSNK